MSSRRENSSKTSSPVSRASESQNLNKSRIPDHGLLGDKGSRMPGTKLFLIDAHALCYRSYYAIKGLINSKGQATNAVYGFVNTLRKILRDYQPEYAAVCFDMKGKTRREEKFVEYKIQRQAMPDDLVTQIKVIRQVIQAYNLPVFEMEGFEADDVIATIAQKFAKDLDVVIVSDDKDMYQLVNDKIKTFSPRQDKVVHHGDVKGLIGVAPEFVTDFIALAGDAVDNIPGVKGIGQVTATKLIEEFGHLEDIYRNIEKIKAAAVKSKLVEQKEMAFLSKELAVLDRNLPLDLSLNAMKVQPPDEQKLLELFIELEFKRLAAEISPQSVAVASEVSIQELKSKAQITKLVEGILQNKSFAFLLEGLDDAEGSVFPNPGRMVIALNGQIYAVSLAETRTIKTLFENPAVTKITCDIKEAIKNLKKSGNELKGPVFDVLLAGYLLSPVQAAADLNALSWQYLKVTLPEESSTAQKVAATAQLYPILEKALTANDLNKLFTDIEIPLAYVLAEMETTGVCLDQELLKKLSAEGEIKIAALLKQIYGMAGEEFNLNSPKQLSEILFVKLKLPVIKKTKTGFSTDEGVLNRLVNDHPIVAQILEYRQIAKLKSTYLDALPKLVSPQTHRLHASFNQSGAETGRLSSQNPNLQNIPIRTELGRQIRKAFIPSGKDNVIMAADYSQIELRILAHLSGDQELKRAFETGEDIHNYTAALIFDVSEKDVTPHMRNTAKRVNFGIIYGMSAFGLSKDLAISAGEAQEFIDKYFLRYGSVKEFMNEQIRKCEKDGYVTTLLNRRRYIPDIKNANMAIRQFAQRQAINTPVQGSAADLIKLAMITIADAIKEEKLFSRMIITVHDELVFDVPSVEVEKLGKLVRERMEHTLPLSVPVKVTLKKGKNWLEMQEIKE